MHKNGKYFFSIIKYSEFIRAVWDPHVYKRNGSKHALHDFAVVARPPLKRIVGEQTAFQPIEYRDIPEGHYLSFALRPQARHGKLASAVVGENALLFGTMRAYLGNIIVTPMADWIDEEGPIHFPVKSEFVVITPNDDLPYYWLAYLRSHHFLDNLPLGSGGTRPRLNPELLAETPITVPPLSTRVSIHNQLKELAMNEWQNYRKVSLAINSLTQKTQWPTSPQMNSNH
ncbi:MAG TPA: hypothetical protein VIS48_08360 [Candidatus Kryptonia bacterium]